MNLKGRSLLTLKDFSKEEILYLLDVASTLKQKKLTKQKERLLENKNIVLIFDKPSTRTRCAFEVAAFDEGGQVTYLTNSQMGKKESIEDTAKVLGRYYDGLQYRGSSQELVEQLAHFAGIPVYNGLTDEDHPTQVLADFLTIREHSSKPLDQIKMVYVGDGRNNMASALMIGAAKVGMHIVISTPVELNPTEAFLNSLHKDLKRSKGTIEVITDPHEAVKDADVIYTDVWVSMGEEDKMEERITLLAPYKVDSNLMKQTGNDNVLFLHCLPSFHDTETSVAKMVKEKYGLDEMEVSDEVFRGKHSVVFDEAENRMHTIKAVLVATLSDVF
jgi:ornithine carbamoyltransferase